MADGAILVVDAQEGPMPQTKFVLKKALDLGLRIIVVINKIDKKDARIDWVIERVHDLFLDLATDVSQLDFPIYFAIAKEGKAWKSLPDDFSEEANLAPIFEAIVEYVPAPMSDRSKPFQMLVTALDRDNYQGKYAIGRIYRGAVRAGMTVTLLGRNGKQESCRVEKIFANQGLKRIEVAEASSGDIVALTGVKGVGIGDTIACSSDPEALPEIAIEEPTLKMSVSANTSPFVGKEGKLVTSRQILDRINRELETNVSLRMELGNSGEFILSGRRELHLSVFIEALRREGFELQVGKPRLSSRKLTGAV
jgi:GTP-binding protein